MKKSKLEAFYSHIIVLAPTEWYNIYTVYFLASRYLDYSHVTYLLPSLIHITSKNASGILGNLENITFRHFAYSLQTVHHSQLIHKQLNAHIHQKYVLIRK